MPFIWFWDTLPRTGSTFHFDGMGLEKKEMDTRLGGTAPCRRCRRSLHERESVSVEKAVEVTRKAGRFRQVSEKGSGGFFAALNYAEQEIFMFVQALLPRIQSGNCDAETLADCRDGRVSLEVGG